MKLKTSHSQQTSWWWIFIRPHAAILRTTLCRTRLCILFPSVKPVYTLPLCVVQWALLVPCLHAHPQLWVLGCWWLISATFREFLLGAQAPSPVLRAGRTREFYTSCGRAVANSCHRWESKSSTPLLCSDVVQTLKFNPLELPRWLDWAWGFTWNPTLI